MNVKNKVFKLKAGKNIINLVFQSKTIKIK